MQVSLFYGHIQAQLKNDGTIRVLFEYQRNVALKIYYIRMFIQGEFSPESSFRGSFS